MGEVPNKIRIFSLAKELGMDSKVLIKYCNDAGVPVKSSALAAISPEEKQLVLDFIAQRSNEPTKPTIPPPESASPARESNRDSGGRMRNLRDVQAREKPRAQSETPSASEVEEPEALGEERPVAAETPSQQPEPVVAEHPAEIAPVVEADQEPAAEAPVAAEATPEPRVEESQQPVAAEDKSAAPATRRDEAAPASNTGVVREMRPRGSGSESNRGMRSGGPGPGPLRARASGPMLAAMPTFKPKEPARPAGEEQKAQKPEIRLTPEQWSAQQSPLGKRLHKEAEDKKGKGVTAKKKDTVAPLADPASRAKQSSDESEGARKTARKDRRSQGGVKSDEDTEDTYRRRSPRGIGGGRRRSRTVVELKTVASVESPITVRRLSEAIGRPAKAIIGSLFKRGQMVTINEVIDDDLAWEICSELGVDLNVEKPKSVDEELEEIFNQDSDPEKLKPRPPIVTILGHVDHGKTTLLDKIRSTDVAGGEAGGITQHIRAYQVMHNGQPITFVDTPGHAAFGEMRARGANVTDIVVLVVAANDSVMPQTVECISHAKAANAAMIVAMNKSDLPDIKETKVLTDLSTHGVQPHEWGGDVDVVRTSGLSGLGIDELLETILITAEINELKADPTRDAVGICLEGFRDEGRGAIAWLIVQKGTLKVGDVILCGSTYGRIRSIYNDRGEEIQEAPPSMPVKVTGLGDVPGAGDRFYVLDDIDLARTVAEERLAEGRSQFLAGRNKPRTLDDILNAAKLGAVQDLNLILKADTPGSIEALRHEIGKLEHPEVRVRVLHEAVGGVNESDVYLASASDAIIIAFNVIAEDRAVQLAEREAVEIRRYDIIYEVTDQIKRTLEGLLQPEEVKVSTGRAIVLQAFAISKVGTIAGCRVLSGTIERSHRIHVIRDQKVMNDYPIASLRRGKDDAKEVREGMECGIRLDGFNDVKEGDLLESFRIDSVKRTLD